MTFLNPSILLGLLAASIPILIHLFNLRKLKKVDFSTLTFLKQLQKNKIRKIKIKQLLLLCIRVIIIICLILAFSRPAIKGSILGGTTAAAKTSSVFIIDDSYSMSVNEGKGSYFNLSKSFIKNLISHMRDGDEVSIIPVSSLTAPQFSNNLIQTNKQVDELKTKDASSNLHKAILNGLELLSKSNNFNKELYIFSDYQEGTLPTKDLLSDAASLVDERTKIYNFNFKGSKVFNAGIDKLKLTGYLPEKNKPADFEVTVSNYSNQNLENRIVSLFINNEKTGQTTTNLKPGETKIVHINAQLKHSGNIEVVAQLEDDEIANDNKRYLSFFVPDQLPVLLLTDSQDDAKYINIALNILNTDQNIKLDEKNLNQNLGNDVNNYSNIIIVGAANNNAFKKYLSAGGSILFFPSNNSNENNVRSFLSSLGIGASVSTILNEKNNFGKIEYTHPVISKLFDSKEKESIESPDIYKTFRISSPSLRSIIQLQNGASFLSETAIDKGKVIVCSVVPDQENSNFPLKSIFPALISRIVSYLSTKEIESNDNFSGNVFDLNVSKALTNQIVAVRPDNQQDYFNIQPDQSSYRYSNTDIAGFYKFSSGGKLLSEIPVNANPLESSSKYISTNDINDYFKTLKISQDVKEIDVNNDPVSKITQARFGSELWRLFLIAAIIAIILEMIISKAAKKDMSQL